MKISAFAALSALAFSIISVAPAAAQHPAASADEVLGSKFHPFSACNMSLGAGFAYARLAASSEWTGFGNGTGSGSLPLAGDGVVAQMGIGCDMHFGRSVIGGYVNYNFGDIGTRVGDTSIDLNRNLNFGGRLGYMVRPEWMLYGKLGLAYSHADFTFSDAAVDKSLKGVQFGIGSEYKIAAPVWLRLEGTGTRYESLLIGDVSVNPTVYQMNASVVFKF